LNTLTQIQLAPPSSSSTNIMSLNPMEREKGTLGEEREREEEEETSPSGDRKLR
jgi:hypothetical protein